MIPRCEGYNCKKIGLYRRKVKFRLCRHHYGLVKMGFSLACVIGDIKRLPHLKAPITRKGVWQRDH